MFKDWRLAYSENMGKRSEPFANYLSRLIIHNVIDPSVEVNVDAPIAISGSSWLAKVIWIYARTGKEATYEDMGIEPPSGRDGSDVFFAMSDDGKEWIDKHLCPYVLWEDPEQKVVDPEDPTSEVSRRRPRRMDGKFCKYTCT